MNSESQAVRKWWNDNPYTYGLSKGRGSYRDVGDVADQQLDEVFFENYMRKCRKRFHDAQTDEQRICERFLNYADREGQKVLDIACGFGWSTVELADAGADVVAIDVTPRAIEVTKRHLEHRGLHAQVLEMDAQHLNFPASTFDYVHAWGCLMHMPDTQRAISELYRVLKPGGEVSGYMYNKSSITYWWNLWFLKGILLGKLREFDGDTQKLVSRYTDGVTFGGNPHTKVYTPSVATQMFEQAGFKNVSFKPWGPPHMIQFFPSNKLPLGKCLSYEARKWVADRLGWGMVFTACKQ